MIRFDIVKTGSCTDNEKPFEDDVIEGPVNILYQAREFTRERSKFEMATWDSDDDLGVDRAVMTVMGMLLPIIHTIEEFVGLSMRGKVRHHWKWWFEEITERKVPMMMMGRLALKDELSTQPS